MSIYSEEAAKTKTQDGKHESEAKAARSEGPGLAHASIEAIQILLVPLLSSILEFHLR